MNDIVRRIEPLIPALRRYARALMKEGSAADDLVQDCLEHALGGWHMRNAEGDVRTWLFAILHNLAINRLRQKSRRGRHVALEQMGEGTRVQPPAQEDRLRYRDLLEKFNELSEEQRSVLLLVTVENLSYAEAARVLGVPIGTVMSRLGRARERLSLAMEGQIQEVEPRSRTLGALRRVK